MVTDLTAATFGTFTDGIVDFWATWCGPCRLLSPILDEIAEENGYNVGKVNVDEEPAIARDFHIEAIPTLVVFKNGAEAGRITGYMPKPMLAAKIADALG